MVQLMVDWLLILHSVPTYFVSCADHGLVIFTYLKAFAVEFHLLKEAKPILN